MSVVGMRAKRMAAAFGFGWIVLVSLACGSGGDDGETPQAAAGRLRPRFDELRTRLAAIPAALPSPGSVPEGPPTPVTPPLAFQGLLPSSFEILNPGDLAGGIARDSTATEFLVDTSESRLRACLRATAANPSADAFYRWAGRRGRGLDEECTRVLGYPYLVIVRSSEYSAPSAEPAQGAFTGGHVVLEGFVVRVATGAIESRFRARAESSHDVDFQYGRSRNDQSWSAQRAVFDDLESSAARAIREALRPISTGLPPPP